MDQQGHVNSYVANGCIWVHGTVVQELDGGFHSVFGPMSLLGCNDAKGSEKHAVNGPSKM